LPHSFVFEASYVGRFAHRLLQEEDLAEPTNLKDTVGGQTYFQAAQALARQYKTGGSNATDISQITPALVGNYWQNLFPGRRVPPLRRFSAVPRTPMASPPLPLLRPCMTCLTAMRETKPRLSKSPTLPAFSRRIVDSMLPLLRYPQWALTLGYDYYSPQFSSMDAWRSIGNSSYNAGQFSLRHRSNGLEFDLNYTYSRSIDVGSNAERVSTFEGGGFASQIINSWFPRQNRAVSDFDTTHIFNANGVYELPFGRGKHFGGGLDELPTPSSAAGHCPVSGATPPDTRSLCSARVGHQLRPRNSRRTHQHRAS